MANFSSLAAPKAVVMAGYGDISHYDDVIMGAMASQITSIAIVYSTVYLGADQSKHQSSASLAFVWGIHRGPVNSPHKWPVTRKMFPFDDVIMDDTVGSCNDQQTLCQHQYVCTPETLLEIRCDELQPWRPCRNIGYSFESNLKGKFRKIPFVHNQFFSSPIGLKFRTGLRNIIRI